MRTITVKGVGTVSAKPDFIHLQLSITSKDQNYNKAMEGAAQRTEMLEVAVQTMGFEKGSLKTTSFNVSTEYESVKDRQGNYRREFVGYICAYDLKLSFDFDSKWLAEVLSTIASSGADPELGISFTVKDPAAVSDELLASATENARRKAEVLCKASGGQLGDLMSIDYNWGEVNVFSRTRYEMGDCLSVMAPCGCAAPEIEPDDINCSDTVTFVWNIH